MKNHLNLKHIVESQQFSREALEFIFELTAILKKDFTTQNGRKYLKQLLAGKELLRLFYETSTRTYLSFAYAAKHLGMSTEGILNAGQFSSAAKGETLEDTIRVVSGYHPDVIILRHNEKGAAKRAAQILKKTNISLINAGDGAGQHPTQAILDLFTMWEKFGSIDGLSILAIGDLKYSRVVRSIAYLISKFEKVEINFISPKSLEMEPDIIAFLKNKNVCFDVFDTEHTELKSLLPDADVVYCTRLQDERMDAETYKNAQGALQINKSMLRHMKKSAITMHPLPRVGKKDTKGRIPELTVEVDSDPRARYFDQSDNGMFVRMALLLMQLDPEKAESLFASRKVT
jgi:aspartate carbamoyltransferase catalytic subunit